MLCNVNVIQKLKHRNGEKVIGACPIIFAYYFKIRCLLRTESDVDVHSLRRMSNEVSTRLCCTKYRNFVPLFATRTSSFVFLLRRLCMFLNELPP